MSAVGPRPDPVPRILLDRLAERAPCRYCGLPAWLTDTGGPVHPCCQFWQDVIAAGQRCPACAASLTAHHEHQRRRAARPTEDQ